MQMSFSIPVVIRNNTEAPQVSIENVKAVPLKDGKSLGLELTFMLVGNASCFGKVSEEMQCNAVSLVELIEEFGEF